MVTRTISTLGLHDAIVKLPPELQPMACSVMEAFFAGHAELWLRDVKLVNLTYGGHDFSRGLLVTCEVLVKNVSTLDCQRFGFRLISVGRGSNRFWVVDAALHGAVLDLYLAALAAH